ncbi:MAG TPA: hypothetical protein VGW38_08565, partial [Chloroflexota bacterium]|nr:hypothetical protein [Chloroflexota bacterium]
MNSLALRLAQMPPSLGSGALWDFPNRRPLLYRGRIRRTFHTPPGAEILVRPGQTLESGTPVARYAHRGRATAVDLLGPLGLSSGREDQLLRSLVHQVGEEVVEGDDLARRTAMGGLQRRSVRAPMTGRVAHVSVETGTLFIAPDAVQLETRAHLAGTVIEVREGAVIVEDTALAVAACAGAGPAVSGPLRFIEAPDSLPDEATGAIVVSTFQVDERAVRAVIDSGAAALVAASVDEDTLERLGWEGLLWPAESRSRLPS